jgi:hypothetical protein
MILGEVACLFDPDHGRGHERNPDRVGP